MDTPNSGRQEHLLDLGRIMVHTNFTATAKQVHEILLEAIGDASLIGARMGLVW